jgi:hypothetical protein
MQLRRMVKTSDAQHTEARRYPAKPDECGMLKKIGEPAAGSADF